MPLLLLLTWFWPIAGLLSLWIAILLALLGVRRAWAAGARGRIVLLGIGLAMAMIPTLGAVAVVTAPRRNDAALRAFERQVLALPLPPGSSVAPIRSRVGVLTGNGNHCDFVVELELSSSQPLDALQAHYASIVLKPALPGGASCRPVVAVTVPAGAARNAYLLTAIDAPYEGVIDPRCH